MMLHQVLGSALAGSSVFSLAYNSQPLQLNPAAAIVMPRAIKNSFSVNGRILDALSFSFVSWTASFSFASLVFQSFGEERKRND
jgi:hypothetical protein